MRLGMTGFFFYFTLYAAGAIFWQARGAAPPAETGFVTRVYGLGEARLLDTSAARAVSGTLSSHSPARLPGFIACRLLDFRV